MIDHSFLDTFEARFGPVSRGLGRLIRPSFIAPKGKVLVWGDWSAIECRVLPWLADSPTAREKLAQFRANDADPGAPDMYKIAAGVIYGKDPYDIAKGPERQTGKVAELSLGFGGANSALAAMATNYGIYLTKEEQDHIIRGWRDGNPWAKRFWSELWEAAMKACENPGTIHEAGRVAYMFAPGYLGGSLICSLPDGRRLTYRSCKFRTWQEEDEETGEMIVKKGMSFMRNRTIVGLWYGILAENITQATAGSLLRRALVTLEKTAAKFPAVGHTHDEIILEPAEELAEEAAVHLKAVMEHNEDWSQGLPLAAEVSTNWYYTKAGD